MRVDSSVGLSNMIEPAVRVQVSEAIAKGLTAHIMDIIDPIVAGVAAKLSADLYKIIKEMSCE